MLSNNQINGIPVKKVCERINCPKCNKPNMSKKNISAHYKAGCSGIWDQYDQKKIKDASLTQTPKVSSKEKKPRQPRKPRASGADTKSVRNKKLSFSCSDFIDFTNWLIENQIILDGDDQDQFHECYQLFKNNQEPPKPPMIIKINLPTFTFIKKEEVVDQPVQELVQESVEESVQFDNIYPSFEEDSFKDGVLMDSGSIASENDMILQDSPMIQKEEIKPVAPEGELCSLSQRDERIKGPTKLKLSKPRKPKHVSDADIESVKEKDVCNALNWHLFNNKKVIDPEDEFFLEDENIENEYPNNTEEEIELRLNKFMERWDDKEIKSYSNNQKKRIDHIIRNEKKVLHGINYMTNIELYRNKYQYNFILRNLINLIKVKLDKLEDEGLSQEESLKKFNEFDKTKIIEKYNDKFNHWADRARNTYELPKSNEWTITTRERPEPTD
jgi:hypothetical protein